MERTIEDLLRVIAVQNDMEYSERHTVLDEMGHHGIVIRIDGDNLRIKDTCIVPEGIPDERDINKIRFRILMTIATAGLKKLEQDAIDHKASHPELYPIVP
jgi:hypothetical protein